MPAGTTERTGTEAAAITRRGFLAGVGATGLGATGLGATGLGVAGFGLAGCGAPSTDTGPSGGAGFPVRIAHKYGTTEIRSRPRRIVVVGLSDHDVVLALGFKPVAVTEWYDNRPYATWPWARAALGSARPTVLPRGNDRLDLERIAALRPDLIIGQYAGMSQEEYNRASQLAPTVAQSGKFPHYGAPWQDTTLTIGRALGQEAGARKLIAGVNQKFAAAKAKYPHFVGRSAVVAELFNQGDFVARSASDPRTRFLVSLGFVLPPDIATMAGTKDAAPISPERIDLLDRDLLMWNAGFSPHLRSVLAANRVYQGLKVVRERREVIVEDKIVSGALTFSTVLSLPYAIDKLTPILDRALRPAPNSDPKASPTTT